MMKIMSNMAVNKKGKKPMGHYYAVPLGEKKKSVIFPKDECRVSIIKT